MKMKHIIRSVLVAELILLVPLIAMAFTNDVEWTGSDFAVAGVLLAFVGIAYQLIAVGIKNNSKQTAIGIVLAAIIILLWVEMAVGLFGSPIAGS